MIFMYMLFINVAFLFSSFTSGNEYEDDEKMYMLVSPDQHSKTPRLEDFFWTGSGDGPPPPDLATPVISPSTPIVRTTTVLATVYLDSYTPQGVTDKSSGECILNCDVTPDSLEPEIPEDRRYWLLTVIQGSTPDSLQLRLARLYQKAFLRQQERHLGIIKSLDAPTTRKKHEVHSFVINNDSNLNQVDPHTAQIPQKYNIHSSMISLDDLSVNTLVKINNKTMLSNINKTDHLNYVEVISLEEIKTSRAIQPTHLSRNSWILVAPTVEVRKRSIDEFEDVDDNKEDMIDLPLEVETDDSNGTVLFKREIIKPEQQPPVQVYIQNITESTEGKIHIVYVVLVGGRAVPAAVAARDMRLVRDAEVATELNAVVTTKAEPAYLKAAEGLEGAPTVTVQGTELWALAIGSTIAVLLLLVVIVLLCVAHRKKSLKSAASLRAYRHELMREAQRSQMKQINEDKDAKLVSVVSPSRTRPSSVLLPIYRAGSASGSSTSSSGISEVAAALRKRQKKPHAFRMPQKTRVGTTDSLLEAAGLDSSDSGRPSPTSYLSMPSINTFPRGNTVEPLSRILEPVSVRHLDEESPRDQDRNTTATGSERDRHSDNNKRNANRGAGRSERGTENTATRNERGRDRDRGACGSERDGERVVRRQMSSQLVRGGSAARDPGVLGPRVWDLHCQRVRDVSNVEKKSKKFRAVGLVECTVCNFSEHGQGKRAFKSPEASQSPVASKESSRMRRRFNELMDDAFTLFGSTNTTTTSQETVKDNYDIEGVTQARNENVRVRGRSAGPAHVVSLQDSSISEPITRPRPRTARAPHAQAHAPPAPAWSAPVPSLPHPTVNPALITAQGRLEVTDPALPLISAIKTEIQRVRDNATKNM